MTSRRLLFVVLLTAGCAVKRPPAPRPIECDEIDRAEERFPAECGEPGDEELEEGSPDEAFEGARDAAR